MQVEENPDAVPRGSESDENDSDTPFQLSARLMERLDELENWRIDASRIEFPDNTCQFHGGHATVLRAILDLGSDEGSDIDERRDADEPENAGDGHESHGHALTGKAVAVKMMKIENENDRERVLKLALREAAFLAELDHKHIIELEGFVEDLPKNRVWLIFPWEENGNLKDFAASQDWEIPERIWLIDDVMKGVEYLHNLNPPICHGDLKSVNILVTSQYRAVITDFGSARRLTRGDLDTRMTSTQPHDVAKPALEFKATFCADTNTMTLTGNQYTLRWAAPELLMDEEPTLCSDIWALGWIFYEVMTDSIPFQHVQKESKIIKQVIEGDLPSVTDDVRMSLILELCSLMIKCWSIDPRGRPTAKDCQKMMNWMPMVAPDPERASKMGVSAGRSPQLLMELGFMHKQQHDYTSASRFFSEALDTYTRTGDSEGRADALFGLADLHFLRDEYDEAIALYTEVLEIRTEIGDKNGRASALRGLAGVHRHQEEYSTAVTLYSEAVQICADIGDRQGRAYALDGLAEVYRFQHEYAKAVALYSEVVAICADLGERDRTADALWSLAEVHRARNKDAEAAALFSEVLRIYTDVGNRFGIANTLLCLAELRCDQDHDGDAIRLYEQAAEIFGQIGNTSMASEASTRAANLRKESEET